jgi:hypothetical protein
MGTEEWVTPTGLTRQYLLPCDYQSPPYCLNPRIVFVEKPYVPLQCPYPSLTNCHSFAASCLVTLVFLRNLSLFLSLFALPPSHVTLRETWWEILRRSNACHTAFLMSRRGSVPSPCTSAIERYIKRLVPHSMKKVTLKQNKKTSIFQKKAPQMSRIRF